MIIKTEKVIKEWTDYNGHMNVAYYIHIFDIAADIMLEKFKMAGESAKKDKKSTFVVETHTTYNQEVKLGDQVEVHLSFLDFDKKIKEYFILGYFFLLSIIIWPMFQEYFDPLIIILAFTFFSTKISPNYKNSIILFIYLSVFLVSANVYYLNLLN